MPDWISPSNAAGLFVALLTAALVAGTAGALASHRGRGGAVLGAVALGGVAFQSVHFIEHGAQLTYWMTAPAHSPWLTPWAESAADGLTWLCTWGVNGRPSIGVEMLHLLGNTIFMTALVGALLLVQRSGGSIGRTRGLRSGLLLQGAHVAEHVLLTLTLVSLGEAKGLSTGFGTLSGETLIAYRVWFHFLLNLVVTIAAIRVVMGMHREGLLPAYGWPGRPMVQPRPDLPV